MDDEPFSRNARQVVFNRALADYIVLHNYLNRIKPHTVEQVTQLRAKAREFYERVKEHDQSAAEWLLIQARTTGQISAWNPFGEQRMCELLDALKALKGWSGGTHVPGIIAGRTLDTARNEYPLLRARFDAEVKTMALRPEGNHIADLERLCEILGEESGEAETSVPGDIYMPSKELFAPGSPNHNAVVAVEQHYLPPGLPHEVRGAWKATLRLVRSGNGSVSEINEFMANVERMIAWAKSEIIRLSGKGKPLLNGPRAPNLFHWEGRDVQIPKMLFDLLDMLWSMPGRLAGIDDVCIAVWNDEEKGTTALPSYITRANARFLKDRLPLTLRRIGGNVVLEVEHATPQPFAN